MHDPTMAAREPNQGGFVQDHSGGWWFVTQQGSGGPEGRTACLLPVTWTNGWPIIGKDTNGDGIGEMVWRNKKPIDGYPITLPQASDEFSGANLSLQWEWFYQPRADKWTLSERPGFLRLYAFKPVAGGGFFKAGNTVSQRFMRGDSGTAIVKIDISHMADGQEAGLCHFNGGSSYATIGVVQAGGGARTFKCNTNGNVANGPALSSGQTFVYFKSVMKKYVNTFYYSLDSVSYTQLGSSYNIVWSDYRGDRIGMYNYNNSAESGYIDIDWFHYTYAGPKAAATAIEPASGERQKIASVNTRVFMNKGTLYFNIPGEKIRRLEIRDLRGRTLFESNGQALTGSCVVPGKLSQGVYLVYLAGRDRSWRMPVVCK